MSFLFYNSNGKERTIEMINTVIFDITGVLVSGGLDDMLVEKGFSEDIRERISKACSIPGVWDEFDKGIVGLEGAIKNFAMHDPELEPEIRETFSDLKGIVKKREYAIPWIRSLKESGYRVLVLSNFTIQGLDDNPFMREFLEETDGGIISYEVGRVKPDPEIYRLLLEKYDLKPQECVFIDDMPQNIEMAKSLGINGIVYKNYEQVQDELHSLLIN